MSAARPSGLPSSSAPMTSSPPRAFRKPATVLATTFLSTLGGMPRPSVSARSDDFISTRSVSPSWRRCSTAAGDGGHDGPKLRLAAADEALEGGADEARHPASPLGEEVLVGQFRPVLRERVKLDHRRDLGVRERRHSGRRVPHSLEVRGPVLAGIRRRDREVVVPFEHREVRDLVHVAQVGDPEPLEVLARKQMVSLHLGPAARERGVNSSTQRIFEKSTGASRIFSPAR